MSGGGSAPQPPSPTESAQAQASAQLAGQMFQSANAPTLAYEDARTRGLIQPYESQLASALAAKSAYNTDPRAYEARQMALQGSNARMGHLYDQQPGLMTPENAGVRMPSQSMLPDLGYIQQLSRMIAPLLSSVSIDRSGNVGLLSPQGSTTNLNARSV